MSGSGRGSKPKGWYSKEQRDARARAFAEVRDARKIAKARREAEKAKRLAAEDARFGPIRRSAVARLRAAHRKVTAARQVDRAALIAAAKVREQQRVDHLVLGKPRPTRKVTVGKRGKRGKTVEVPVELDPEIERAVARRESWAREIGTPETLEAAKRHTDSFLQLVRNGTIDKDQAAAAEEIADIHRSIVADVAISIASLEARVDSSPNRGTLVPEGIYRVRMHLAYRYWFVAIPAPKQLVLDMIVDDPIGYSVAARRYRVWHQTARRLLIESLDRWPRCVAHAFDVVDDDAIDRLRHAQDPGCDPVWLRSPVFADHAQVPRAAAPVMREAPTSAEIGAIDPGFLNERGLMRELTEIAEVIRVRFAEHGEAA